MGNENVINKRNIKKISFKNEATRARQEDNIVNTGDNNNEIN